LATWVTTMVSRTTSLVKQKVEAARGDLRAQTSGLEVGESMLVSQVPLPQARADGVWRMADGSDHMPYAISHMREAPMLVGLRRASLV
jgi:hypothetical protein